MAIGGGGSARWGPHALEVHAIEYYRMEGRARESGQRKPSGRVHTAQGPCMDAGGTPVLGSIGQASTPLVGARLSAAAGPGVSIGMNRLT